MTSQPIELAPPRVVPLAIVVLGNDAVIAAQPYSARQLDHACAMAGFDVVIPPTWGDELAASALLEALDGLSDRCVVACSCPKGAERRSRGIAWEGATCRSVAVVAPPVAAARYARAVYRPPLTLTFVGDCPGGADNVFDSRIAPSHFIADLRARGLLGEQVSAEGGERAAKERHAPPREAHGAADVRGLDGRYYSLPGGIPARRWLARAPISRVLREAEPGAPRAAASPNAASATGSFAGGRDPVLVDPSVAIDCACGRDRERLAEIEPPRAARAIIERPPGMSWAPVRLELAAEPNASPPVAAAAFVGTAAESQPPAPLAGRRHIHARASARSAGLVTTCALVLGTAATLTATVYAVSTRTGAERAREESTRRAEQHSAATFPATRLDSGLVASTRAIADSAAAAESLGLALDSSSSASVSPVESAETPNIARSASPRDSAPPANSARRAVRRAPRYEVVPGWLPQGAQRWDPTDTAARRDSVRAPPTPDTSGVPRR